MVRCKIDGYTMRTHSSELGGLKLSDVRYQFSIYTYKINSVKQKLELVI